jgi:Acetyltransferase (GNAT) family
MHRPCYSGPRPAHPGADGEIAGVLALAPGDEPGALDLNKLFVEPRHIRSGAGWALPAHAVAEARQRGAERLTIVADPNATGFYERNGAAPAAYQPRRSGSGLQQEISDQPIRAPRNLEAEYLVRGDQSGPQQRLRGQQRDVMASGAIDLDEVTRPRSSIRAGYRRSIPALRRSWNVPYEGWPGATVNRRLRPQNAEALPTPPPSRHSATAQHSRRFRLASAATPSATGPATLLQRRGPHRLRRVGATAPIRARSAPTRRWIFLTVDRDASQP